MIATKAWWRAERLTRSVPRSAPISYQIGKALQQSFCMQGEQSYYHGPSSDAESDGHEDDLLKHTGSDRPAEKHVFILST